MWKCLIFISVFSCSGWCSIVSVLVFNNIWCSAGLVCVQIVSGTSAGLCSIVPGTSVLICVSIISGLVLVCVQ